MGDLNSLAMAGSLRRQSSNLALLQAAIALAPTPMTIKLYSSLVHLPYFHPDHELDPIPAVLDFRAQRQQSNAVVIGSPEYAHHPGGQPRR